MATYARKRILGLIRKSEAARRMEVSPARVSIFIRDKTLGVYKGPDGREMVDEDEVENAKTLLRANRRKHRPLPPIEPEQPAPATAAPAAQAEPKRSTIRPVSGRSIAELTEDDFYPYDQNGRVDLVVCRAWGEYQKAQKLKFEREALEGRYIEAEKIRPALESVMLTIRKGVMATPSRLKAVETEITQKQLDTLERLLREVLDKAVVDI